MLQSGKAEKPCYGHIHIQGRSYVSSVWKNKYMHTILYHCFYFKQSCSMNSKKVVYSVTSICCLEGELCSIGLEQVLRRAIGDQQRANCYNQRTHGRTDGHKKKGVT